MPADSLIYHYCPVSAFPDIMRDGKIWLTHFSGLNDSAEMIWPIDAIDRITDGMATEENRKFLEQVKGRFQDMEAEHKHVYVTSLSGKGDVLSQWRAYASDGAGFAIGFRKASLGIKDGLPMAIDESMEGIGCFPIKYDNDQMELFIRNFLDFGIPSEIDTAAWFLRRTCLEFKNPAFIEENEWRIAYIHNIDYQSKKARPKVFRKLSTMKFRNTVNGLTPYFELAFDKSAVAEIVLGPKNPSILVGLFLEKHGYRGIEIRKSTASYR